MFPITATAQLPKVGMSTELPGLDFKATVSSDDRFELAKDIAALANVAGGTIIIGAVHREQRIVEYRAVPHDLAEELDRAYTQAARDFCSPTPCIEARVISTEDQVNVLVVNVPLSPIVPVGVRLRQTAQKTGGRSVDSWVFPRRVGSHTQYLQPDQFGILENMTARHAAALLSGIPDDQRKQIRVTSDRKAPLAGGLEDLSVEKNVAIFLVGAGPPQASYRLRVPLNWIHTVWRDDKQGAWEVVLDERVLVEKPGEEWVVRLRNR